MPLKEPGTEQTPAGRRADDEPPRSEARFGELFEHAPDGILIAGRDGRCADVNEAGCRMLGYTRDEIIGKAITDLVPDEDVARLARADGPRLEGETQVSERLARRKDGTLLPVEVSASILADGRWQGFLRDITERERARVQLQESRDRLELALRGADLSAWDWNVKTGQVIFNSRWAEMRGFDPEEIEPHVDSWIAGVHPGDWPRVNRVLTDYFEGKVPEYETEHRVLAKSGEWIWILDRGKVFERDEQGRPLRMVGTELDITERKRTEEALRLSEAKVSGILAISADAIVSIDEQQRITMFNHGAEAIFGYSAAEVIGAPLDVLIPERHRAVHRTHVETFAAGPETANRMGPRSRLTVGLRKSGEEFPADATISKLEVGGTRILTVALRDITEQRRNENEQEFLAEASSVLASTLEYEETLTNVARLAVRHLADFCLVDIVEEDGAVRRLKVVSRDPSQGGLCTLLEKMPLDRERHHLARSALETRQPVLMQGLRAETIASLAQSEEHLRVLRAIDPKSIMATPLLVHGKLMGVLTFVSSTPSRPYQPRHLRVAEELGRRAALSIENARLYRAARRAIQSRDDVLGVVAHDLRNPLNSIVMQAELIHRQCPQPEQLSREWAGGIKRAAQRMNRLIQDLLDVTQIDSGTLSLQRVPAAPQQLLSDVVDAERALASSASLELQLDATRELPEVWVDRFRLHRVFENLIGNAVKFTTAGGRITVGAAAKNREVVFWVADTGAGIPPEGVPHLFDRFWQARRADHRGAGLGLAIVKGIVEAHGGHVSVESTPGGGSTFFFTIPTAPQPDA
jgi:PAS domain S-box-containing protein